MELPREKTLLLFDGYCHLCSWVVRFILRFDKKRKFLFSPLSGEPGDYWRKKLSVPEDVNSIILIDKGSAFLKGDAALEVAKKLGGIFHIAQVFYGVPKKYRDQFYDWVAANRYRWFGKYNSCMIPRPEFKDRFI